MFSEIAFISETVRDGTNDWNLGHFLTFQKLKKKLKKHKFALMSETIRDRAKRTKFGDHIHCQLSQQFFLNISKI